MITIDVSCWWLRPTYDVDLRRASKTLSADFNVNNTRPKRLGRGRTAAMQPAYRWPNLAFPVRLLVI